MTSAAIPVRSSGPQNGQGAQLGYSGNQPQSAQQQFYPSTVFSSFFNDPFFQDPFNLFTNFGYSPFGSGYTGGAGVGGAGAAPYGFGYQYGNQPYFGQQSQIGGPSSVAAGGFGSGVGIGAGGAEGAVGSVWRPRADVGQTDSDFLIHLEVPGVRMDQIKIEVANDVLTVRGERLPRVSGTGAGAGEKDSETLARAERRVGPFQRSFSLPVGIETSRIRAILENGVLVIRVPKPENLKSQAITIPVTKS